MSSNCQDESHLVFRPHLALGDELFRGADTMPMAEASLASPALLQRGEMARLATLPIGIERRRG